MKSRRSNVLASGGAARRQCNGENCCRGPSLVYIARAGASRRFISIAQAETFFHCPREEKKEEGGGREAHKFTWTRPTLSANI